ncbi:MAG: asparagine synthase (glutamine-hydrolyzing) [Phycisphaerales bacterium JB059]
MCGILAIASPTPLAPDLDRSPAWRGAMERLGPRGPDGAGVWRSPEGDALFGHTRLAIQDLSDAGAQPMTDPSGRVAIVFNGEIYNAPALRRELAHAGAAFRGTSDTEVLLHAFLAWGLDRTLERVEGMFALLIRDGRTGELHGAVDPTGQKPLYLAEAAGSIAIASDAIALRRAVLANAPLSYTGLCHVLRLGYCPAPATAWAGIRKLAPGTRVRWSAPGGLTTRRYWEAPEAIDRARSAEPFAELLTRVVSEHLLSDVPVALLLSAGIDSGALALALRDAGATPGCVTLAMAGEHDESADARALADHLGLPHTRVEFTDSPLDDLVDEAARAFDEPQVFGALLTQTRVASAARAQAKVVLTGDGGDEAFAGYAWHAPPPRATDQHGALSEHATRVMPWFSAEEAARLLEPLRRTGEPVYTEEAAVETLRPHDRPGLPWPRRAQRLDLGGFCAGSILPKVDRASMRVGLEMRAPLLDRRILEWAISRPVEPGEGPKAPLRALLNGRVPERTLTRPKQGFSLRIADPTRWHDHVDRLGGSPFMKHALDPSWTSACERGAPYAHSRAYALTFLARWAEAHGAC